MSKATTPKTTTKKPTKNSLRRPANAGSDDGTFWYDEKAGERPIEFARKYIKHIDDHFAGMKFEPVDWQADLLRKLFGTKKKDGTRRYRTLYLEIPRKNGKSTFAALIAIFVLFCCALPRAQVVSAALNREQAGIVFEMAKAMIQASPALMKRCKIGKKVITVNGTKATYRAVSADSNSAHGLKPFCILFDELHVQKNRHLYDALRTGRGTQLQPLEIIMTTAGHDVKSIGYEVHHYAEQVRDGVFDDTGGDPTFLPVIFGASKGDNWEDPLVWMKCNPNLGHTMPLANFEEEYQKAKRLPGYVNTFKRLYLNIWTDAKDAWIPQLTWKRGGRDLDLEKYRGRQCFIALDLSKRIDITAASIVFPNPDGTFDTFCQFWMPEENLADRETKDRVPYRAWAQEKKWRLDLTPGEVVDYEYIEEWLLKMLSMFKVQEVAFDPWGSTQLSNKLQKVKKLPIVEFGQGYKSMSPAAKDFEIMVTGNKLHHENNPILGWMLASTVIDMDPSGNIKPNKCKSNTRIDGVVALVMALSRAIAGGKGRSAYASGQGFKSA